MQAEFHHPHIQDLAGLADVLVRDFEFCKPHLNGEDSMFWRRAFARSVCAYIEGTLSAMRRFALSFAESKFPSETAIISLLRKESYFTDSDGTARTRVMRSPRLKYLAMIFRYYAESLSSGYQLDQKSKGWQSLTTAFQIRDRITHPEIADDLEITDSEIRAIEEAFCFFWNSFARLWPTPKLR
jgi:hypothetical protein